jgi:hypothetical protein
MSEPIRLRFVTFLAPNVYPLYRFITRYVGEKLKLATEISTGYSFNQFANSQADVGFI